MEVVRDKADNCIIVCSIENIDPMGVHTGDSITVAPALTLTDKEYQIMRDASIAVLREIGVETGGSNVQFAVNPADGRMVVIEMNPRVSRSSALASKATGFPIAKVAAKLAVGYTLDELANDITGGATPASFEPTIDYVVTKIPRFAFEKFPGAEPMLTTSMKSVGEAMAIGRTFAGIAAEGAALAGDRARPASTRSRSTASARATTRTPSAPRSARRRPTGCSRSRRRCASASTVERDPRRLQDRPVVPRADRGHRRDWKREIARARPAARRRRTLRALKAHGLLRRPARRARRHRPRPRCARSASALDVRPVFKRIDTCAAEFASPTAYMYSTYETPFAGDAGRRGARRRDRKKVVILGGGPNRIGQGIEFDYCCCHACFALTDAGFETDHGQLQSGDRLDRLRHLRPALFRAADRRGRAGDHRHASSRSGTLHGVIVQFGGQTPLKLAARARGGRRADPRHLARRHRPRRGPRPLPAAARQARLQQPKNGIAYSRRARRASSPSAIGFPLVVRPSYVLGGRAMEIVHDDAAARPLLWHAPDRPMLERQDRQITRLGKNPLLFDRYLSDAIEVDVDCLCDGKDVFVAGIMEHIEEAGIHSGDCACSLPPHSLSPETIAELERQTRGAGAGAQCRRPDERAVRHQGRRHLRARGQPARLAHGAVRRQGHRPADRQDRRARSWPARAWRASSLQAERQLDHIAVKEAVFPFARFPGVDTVLGPEMRSTGEVMGLDRDFRVAFAKSQLGGGTRRADEPAPCSSRCATSDKPRIARADAHCCAISASRSSPPPARQRYLAEQRHRCGQRSTRCWKAGRISSTPSRTARSSSSSTPPKARRRSRTRARCAAPPSCIKCPYYTTLSGAVAAAQGIKAYLGGDLEVRALQSYFSSQV